MNTKTCMLLLLLSLSGMVRGDRILDKAEIEKIFKVLTDKQQKTWISSGIIYANHEEFRASQTTIEKEINERIDQAVRAYLSNPRKTELTEKSQQMKLEAIPFNVQYQLSNEFTMSSKVVLKYDGNRFYWEIMVNSRDDSVKPTDELLDNSYIERFDLGWNQHRIFAWDGSKYINYFRPGNQAIIENQNGNVNGPLTAGIITWGYGKYSYKNLLQATNSAIEIVSKNQIEIHLLIENEDYNEFFILDPLQYYSVKFYELNMRNGLTKVCRYNNYQYVGDRWCPGTIMIEQYDENIDTPKLISYDIWNFTSIITGQLDSDVFSVNFEYDALIDDYRFGNKPFRFRYTQPEYPADGSVDISGLILERLELLNLYDSQNQNCATASLKYVCTQLGYDVAWDELSQLVKGTEKSTNMLNMQEFLNQLGLYSLAVKTDLEHIKLLDDYQVILYLPNINHYVVFANTDKDYTRLIDLDQNNLYYRQKNDGFSKKWDGTAIVVDKKPMQLNNNFTKISDNVLSEIAGASTCQQCNTKIQDPNTISCSEPYPGGCGGTYKILYEIWQCGEADSGSCSEDDQIKYKSAPCVIDQNYNCSGNGSWTSNSISGC